MTNSAIIAIAAAIAIAISTLGPSIGQGLTAKAAMESIARQPDAAKDIRSTLIISLALMAIPNWDTIRIPIIEGFNFCS